MEEDRRRKKTGSRERKRDCRGVTGRWRKKGGHARVPPYSLSFIFSPGLYIFDTASLIHDPNSKPKSIV